MPELPDFDHDAWRTAPEPEVWKRRGLSWRCYLWYGDTGTAQGPQRDQLCGDLNAATPPVMTRDWLNKPKSMVQKTASTPDQAVTWLVGVFDSYAPRMTNTQASDVPRDVRFGRARYELACGLDLSWGFVLGGQYLALGVVAVS